MLVHGTQLLLDDELLHLVNHGHFRRLILAVDPVDLVQHSLLLLCAHNLKVGLDLLALPIVLYFALADLPADTLRNISTLVPDGSQFLRCLN